MDSLAVSGAGMGVVTLVAWSAWRLRKRDAAPSLLCGGRVVVRARLLGTPETAATSSVTRLWNAASTAWLRWRAQGFVHGTWPGGARPCVVSLNRRPRASMACTSPFELGFHSSSPGAGSLAFQVRVALVGLAGALVACVAGRAVQPPSVAPPLPARPAPGDGALEAASCREAHGRLFVASIASPSVHSFKRGTTTFAPGTVQVQHSNTPAYTLTHSNVAAWHTNAPPSTHSNTIGRHSNASNHVNLDLRPLPQYPL